MGSLPYEYSFTPIFNLKRIFNGNCEAPYVNVTFSERKLSLSRTYSTNVSGTSMSTASTSNGTSSVHSGAGHTSNRPFFRNLANIFPVLKSHLESIIWIDFHSE